MVKKMWIFSSILAYEAKRLAGVRLRWLYSWLKKQEHACIFSMSVQHASWNFSKINPISEKKITSEACVSHLMFCDEDYKTLGARIKCNPSIKTKNDRDMLRRDSDNKSH